MNLVLSIAIFTTLATSLFLVVRYRKFILNGTHPVNVIAFTAILFTSGLDVGLIMFPLTEFPTYQSEAPYSFTNPLAIEFGFWAFLVWGFYFLTTFYFCAIEPKLKLFEIPWVKFLNNAVIIATCAFTGFLFLSYLPTYIQDISPFWRYTLVAVVVLCAAFSSTDVAYIKGLSFGSSFLFFALILAMYMASNMQLSGLAQSAMNISGYFENIHRFISPLTDYHAFYLFWWFAWSIMIGQFVARFVGNLKTWQLLIALLVLPSIPIALWFSVLFYYHTQGLELTSWMRISMVIVGVIFVINSLDSLIRLYSENLNLSTQRFGKLAYIGIHWSLLFGLILLYQFTPLKIEWVGLLVIALYAAVYVLVLRKRKHLGTAN